MKPSKLLSTAAVVLAPVLLLGPVSFILLLGDSNPAVADCGPSAAVTISDDTKIEGYSAGQLKNAAAIMNAGKSLNLSAKGQMVSVMVALGESGLRVLDTGDAAGPDSRGLFQQRDNGAWGSYADRMNPTVSAANFIKALQRVEGWELLEPTIAANRVQRNADPYHYQRYWGGFFVSVVGVPSFLATLGMLGMAQGAAMWITGAAPQAINDLDFTFLFGDSNIGPIPGLLLWTLVIVLIGHVGLRRTGFGRQVLATGGNSKAAAFSGVHTKRVVFLVLLLSSVLAALAGMLYAGRFHTGSYNTGTGDELSVIAAVILGGTSLFGGRASVVGALLGSLMIGLLNNGLILMGLDSAQQQVARGAIIILAVAVTARRRV